MEKIKGEGYDGAEKGESYTTHPERVGLSGFPR
jgi:hypothetical protein